MTRTDKRSSLPRARVVTARAWLGPALAAAVYLPGALYVLAVNRWHLTAPVVMLLLCWAAVVTLGYHLTRMAAVINDPDEVEAPVTGTRDELEREKKKLVKGIKEVEFDRECGKMSDADATLLISTYRQRAIEVLRELERLDADRPDTARARVEADLKSRLELEHKLAQAGKAGRAKAAQAAKASALRKPGERFGVGAGQAAAPAPAPIVDAPAATDVEASADDAKAGDA